MSPIIRCENIAVQYGSFTALSGVSMTLEPGKIHALVGQNGAGKTSLARVLSGLVVPSQGAYWIADDQIVNGTVHRVRQAGLDIVHQRFTLPPKFSIAEALELSSAKKQAGSFYQASTLRQAWEKELATAGISSPASTLIQDLPVEVVQSLEILRALSDNAKVLILDEPTALLSPSAVEDLFDRMRQLKADGVTLLVILHKLREVLDIADTVSVLRGGRLVLPPTETGELSAGELSDLIIGGVSAEASGAEDAAPVQNTASHSDQSPHLSLNNVVTVSSETEPALKSVSLCIYPGEIVGIAGVEGNGQRGIVNALTGQTNILGGEISLLQQNVSNQDAIARRQIGLRVVPFDRMTEGSSLELPLWENVMAWQAETFVSGWFPWLPVRKVRQAAADALDRFGVKYHSLDQPAGSLSGGNLQRLILARELASNTQVVIAAQPTRGLDFQATDFVWQVLKELRSNKAGVLLVSSDLDELFNISDRVLAIRAGEIVGEFKPPFNHQAVGDAMIGAQR